MPELTKSTGDIAFTEAPAVERIRKWFAADPEHSDDVVAARGAVITQTKPVPFLLHHADDPQLRNEGVQTVAYEGGPMADGREISIGQAIRIRFENYSVMPYTDIQCPMVVAVSHEADRRILLLDAENARREGIFPIQLVHPFVTLLDEKSWMGASDSLRLWAPGDPENTLGHAKPGISAPSGVVGVGLDGESRKMLEGEYGPDIKRFLSAAKLLKSLQYRLKGTIRISGFGYRIPGDDTDSRRTDAIFTVAADGQFYVADAALNSLARVSREIAVLVECVMGSAAIPKKILDGISGVEGVRSIGRKLSLAKLESFRI